MKKFTFKNSSPEVKSVGEVEAHDASEAWKKFMATGTYRECPIARKTGGGFSYWILNEEKST